MKVIGILGGVASGKSLVAEQLRGLGAEVLDADQIGHLVLREPDVVRAVRKRWGDAVIGEDGQIIRAAVAKIVFASSPEGSKQLAFLEQLTHPRIGARLQQEVARLAAGGSVKAVVLDAPVMLKAGWDTFCDHILFVESSQAQRIERARQRGWTEAAFVAREAAQESLQQKRGIADVVIRNSGTPEETLAQVEAFWKSLL